MKGWSKGSLCGPRHHASSSADAAIAQRPSLRLWAIDPVTNIMDQQFRRCSKLCHLIQILEVYWTRTEGHYINMPRVENKYVDFIDSVNVYNGKRYFTFGSCQPWCGNDVPCYIQSGEGISQLFSFSTFKINMWLKSAWCDFMEHKIATAIRTNWRREKKEFW